MSSESLSFEVCGKSHEGVQVDTRMDGGKKFLLPTVTRQRKKLLVRTRRQECKIVLRKC